MANRESYTYPSNSGFGNDAMQGVSSAGVTVSYICGECASKVALSKNDPIRCSSCGHRVLYKERTKRMVQFEAR
ncbi:hypothetical protein BT93_L0456 [Corymbia citriodora subsp. variegata]|uniref:DNA-directed RNA polymerase subunit P n=1 Tax=Corymbia citriodora subsp. variegata TaxID=360336 RepID=A0A8T0CIP3_CORYI|nr:hypothetical protein BT93_L0456 [Corymbia citriodora subsp. variegata]